LIGYLRLVYCHRFLFSVSSNPLINYELINYKLINYELINYELINYKLI